ncbi:MAG: amidohydrolase family protein, partial [Woeseia sp.]
DAYEHASKTVGPLDNRHHIVHLQLIDEADIPRFAELGVAASFQGVWAYPDEYIDVAEALVGKDRVARFYPVASVERAGGLVVGGSDWDVSSLNPLDAIETLVRRQDAYEATGPQLGVNENLSLASALQAYTSRAAYLMGLEKLSGSIEVGKRADLIVIDRDLFAGPATDINNAEVVLTLVDGKEVFRADRL